MNGSHTKLLTVPFSAVWLYAAVLALSLSVPAAIAQPVVAFDAADGAVFEAEESVCNRTWQVRREIVNLSAGVVSCHQVTRQHLARITWLDFRRRGIEALRRGDFSGLDNLKDLNLYDNELEALPAGIFSGLSSLKWLDLDDNGLEALPADIFSGLGSLEWLDLTNNHLSELPAEVFSNLNRLRSLYLADNRLETLPAEVFSSLGRLTSLSLSDNRLETLPAEVFSNLNSLKILRLYGNRLETLPADVFSGIERLEFLSLWGNQLNSLPAGLFSGLGRLAELRLQDNQLNSLPADVFSGLGGLKYLVLSNNRLETLPAGMFSGLSSLAAAPLYGNPGAPFRLMVGLERAGADFRLTVPQGVPYSVIVDLSADGGTVAPNRLVLPAGSTQSEVITVTRAGGGSVVVNSSVRPAPKTGYCPVSRLFRDYCFGDVKVVAGAPFVMEALNSVAPAVSDVGIISNPHEGNAYAAGGGERITVAVAFDWPVTVTPSSDGPALVLEVGATTRAAVYAPDSSSSTRLVFHYTPTPSDSDDDGVSIVPGALVLNGARIEAASGDAAGVAANLDLGDHAITNAAGHKVRPIPPSVLSLDAADGAVFEAEEGAVVNLTVTVDSAPATDLFVRYRIGADGDVGTADADSSDYSHSGAGGVTIAAGTRSALLPITITDDTEIDSPRESLTASLTEPAAGAGYVLASPSTVTVVIKEGVCDRTPQVRWEIVNLSAGIVSCHQVTRQRLARITRLDLSGRGIEALRRGDFSGLDNLIDLDLKYNKDFEYNENLDDNGLEALPAGIFSGLDNLEWLELDENELEALPAGIFSGLSNLKYLDLYDNKLEALPAGIFSGLSNLKSLDLKYNELEALPAGIFSGLDNLERLELDNNELEALSAGIFSGLSNLKNLYLSSNRLETLPADVFSNLGRLESLSLSVNRLETLPADVFSNLDRLERLSLHINQLETLPADVFSNLGRLENLFLSSNSLETLPPNVFLNLKRLEYLTLSDNPGAPFRLTVGLERAGADFRLTVPQGVPYSVIVDLSADGGTVSPNRLVLPAGSTQSEVVTVTHAGGGPVVVNSSVRPVPRTGYCPLPRLFWVDCFRNVKVVAGAPFVMEALAPAVSVVSDVEITSNPREGDAYVAGGGERITVAVAFDWPVTVTPSSDGPTLVLEVGTTTRIAVYDPDSSSPTRLVFHYTPTPSDSDDDGISIAPGALVLNGARIEAASGDAAGVAANLDLGDHAITNAAGHKVRPMPPSVLSFESSTSAAEGETAELVVNVHPPARSLIVVNYRFDHGTADAADYLDAGEVEGVGNVLVIPSGAATGVIRIPIIDDDDIESPRESFTVSLSEGVGYILASPSSATVTIHEGVCDRTRRVRDALVSGISRVQNCAEVIAADLAAFAGPLNLSNRNVTTLRRGDFSGLGELRQLSLSSNRLGELPAGVFSGLGKLEKLWLWENRLTSLPAGVFSDLGELEWLHLYSNRLSELPAGAFSGLGKLDWLTLVGNELETLPAEVFSSLAKLRNLELDKNHLNELSAEVFSGLGELRHLGLSSNRLSVLSGDVFSGLGELRQLDLTSNRLSELPGGLFSGLGELQSLQLSSNRLGELPPGVFSGLGELRKLYLHANRLGGLSAGVFAGLDGLSGLSLYDNPGAPFRLAAGLERDDADPSDEAVLRLTLPQGAPYEVTVDFSVEGGTVSPARMTLPAGGTQGGVVTVTRDGAGPVAVSSSVGAAPGSDHCFYLGLVLFAEDDCFLGFEIAAGEAFVLEALPPVVSGAEIISAPRQDGVHAAGGGERIQALNQNVESRELTLSFEPSEVEVAAGGSTEVSLVLGNAGALAEGEEVNVTLTATAGVELSAASPLVMDAGASSRVSVSVGFSTAATPSTGRLTAQASLQGAQIEDGVLSLRKTARKASREARTGVKLRIKVFLEHALQ